MHGHRREGRRRLASAREHATGAAHDLHAGTFGAVRYLEAMQAEEGLAQTDLAPNNV
jgi:hypothetical protein